MKMPEEDPLRRYVEHILDSGERAAELTRSLLAFSRKQIINPKAHDLNGIVRDLEKMLKRVIGETMTFSTLLSAGELAVFVDRSQIEQVIMNLVTNARDAMPEGGAISIETGTAAVDESFAREHGLAADGAYAVLTVADTGVGMDDETLANIFEPFFTTKEVGKGTGLGLAIVYGIVTQHGGTVDVYSEPGKGSAFRIYLPKAAAGAGERDRQAEPPPTGGSETILVAEDEASVRKLISLVLGEAGYTVAEARSGAEALSLFEAQADRIGLVLLDVIMPEGNGKEVYDAVMLRKPGTKVLFMSGYTDDIIHAQGVLDENLDYIAKPVSPAALLRKVRDVLDR